MPITQLYDTWKQRILELRPDERKTRVRNFAWLLVGIFESRSVYLSRIAGKIPGKAKRPSTTRRLRRLLDNPAIRVREWYEPVARQWLQAQFKALREIRLIVDGTKVGFAHQLLIVSIADRLDLGQARSGAQYRQQTDRPAQLCQEFAARRNGCVSGRRH